MINELGTCSWTLGIDDPKLLFKKVKGLGLDGLQFSGDGRQYKAQDIKAAAETCGMKIFAVDPFDCKPEAGQEATAEAAIIYYKRYVIDFAVEAGSPWVTIQGLTQWTKNCSTETAAWQRLVNCCIELDKYAVQKNIRLVFEAVNRYESPMVRTAAECLRLLSDIGNTDIGVVLDSFHMNIEEHAACDALQLVNKKLVSYHVSDSNRGGIGSGHIDFLAHYTKLKEIGFNGPVMIELVLPYLSPSTPPRNQTQSVQLDQQIKSSISLWKSFN